MLATWKKQIITLVVVCALVAVFAVPVSATEWTVYDYNDYITDTVYGTDGNTVIVTLDRSFLESHSEWYAWTTSWSQVGHLYGYSGYFDYTFTTANNYILKFYPCGDPDVWELTYIPDGTSISCEFTNVVEGATDYGYVYSNIAYYDANFNKLSETDTQEYYAGTQSGSSPVEYSFTVTKPTGARYMRICYQFRPIKFSQSSRLYVQCTKVTLNMNIPALLAIQQQQAKTNDLLDELLEQQQNERNEADSTGSSGVNDISGAIPDYSSDLKTAFSSLASSLQYNGTEAKLHIPDVNVPGVEGLYDGFTILEPQTIDFESYIEMMPSGLMLLVQSLLTIALILFCVKELYGLISYILTLRGVGSDE